MPILALSVLSFTACVEAADDEEDAIDGTFADGKADGLEVLEGTPEAAGVLKLVNEASTAALDDLVGLSSRAATGIVEARKGVDGVLLTEDDQIIWTLDELDAVKYVGVSSLRKLVAFAHANDYVTDTYRILYYSYGTNTARSRLYLLSDGTGYVEDDIRGGAGLLERSKIEGVPAELVDELRGQITDTLDGELEESTLPARLDAPEPTGTLTVFGARGATAVVDSYELEDHAILHTRNAAAAAEDVRAVARDLVRVTMPE